MSEYEEYLKQRVAGLPPLQKVMLELDTVLTGKAPTEIVRQYHHYPVSLEHWIKRDGWQFIWYLSDGGYSRVVWNEENGNLFLTDNSTQRVKANWEAAAPQRQAVADELRKQWDALAGGATQQEAQCLVDNILNESPKLSVLKQSRRSLSPEEKKEAGDAPVWKATVNGKTYYVCNTHRAYQTRSTPKAAAHAWFNGVEQTG